MSSEKVLFVCLGNICRSPMAESVFSQFSSALNKNKPFDVVDSCGTAGYHCGEVPDYRTIQVLKENGIQTSHRARQLSERDFDSFDYIFCMDTSNKRDIDLLYKQYLSEGGKRKPMIELFGSFIPQKQGSFTVGEYSIEVQDSTTQVKSKKNSYRFSTSKLFGEVIEDPYYDGIEEFNLTFFKCLLATEGFLGRFN